MSWSKRGIGSRAFPYGSLPSVLEMSMMISAKRYVAWKSDDGFPMQSMWLTNASSLHSFSWTELIDLKFLWQFARDDLNLRNHSSANKTHENTVPIQAVRHRSPVEDMCLDENFSLQWRLRRQKLFPKPVKQFPWEGQWSKKMTTIPLCWYQNTSYQKGERPEMLTWFFFRALKWIVFRVWSYSILLIFSNSISKVTNFSA